VTYVPAVANQGACTAGEITAFINVCGDNYDPNMCGRWLSFNISTDAGAGTACGDCIFASNNAGGTWSDPNGIFNPNYAGCIQLVDSAHGAACAAALNNANACDGVACDFPCMMATNTAYYDCLTAAAGGECMMYTSAAEGACTTDFADGGANDTCMPGKGMGQNPDYQFILTLICGGADGGAVDGGPTDGAITDGAGTDGGG
jgi:hypothetical protein